jgi:hypothetical protein
MAWATFIRDDCEWSGPEAAASCFGHREPGFRVRAVRAAGARWYVWDPTSDNFACVSRNALSLPAELRAVVTEGAPRPTERLAVDLESHVAAAAARGDAQVTLTVRLGVLPFTEDHVDASVGASEAEHEVGARVVGAARGSAPLAPPLRQVIRLADPLEGHVR